MYNLYKNMPSSKFMKVSTNLKQMKVNKNVLFTLVKEFNLNILCSTTNYMIILSFDYIKIVLDKNNTRVSALTPPILESYPGADTWAAFLL